MASDLKRAAEQEEQLADKKPRIEKPADDLEDDSWADAITTTDKPKASGGSSSDTPIVDATAASADTKKAAAADTKEAAAVDAPAAAASADTKEASVNTKEAAPVVAEAKEAAPVVAAEAASASSQAPTVTADDDKAKAQAKAEEEARLIDSLTVCVRSISYSVEEDQFELDFGDHGEIEEMNFLANRGMAFVTYTSKEAVEAALKMDGDEYWGRKLVVIRADPKRAPAADTFEAFVKGLPAKCEEDAVRTHFAPCGEIIRIKMRPGEEGKSKATAYVTFKTEEALDQAVKLDAKMFQDANISVCVADQQGGKGKDKGKGKGKGKDKGKGKGKGKGKKGKGKSR